MQRLLLVLLVLVLPLQFAWAGAAAYCGHEVALSAKAHFGHHEHRHQAGSSEQDQPADPAQEKAKLNLADPDCGVCHIASLPFAPADAQDVSALHRVELAPPLPQPRFSSHSARAPDRPQWPSLA
ncbi:Cobalt-zinc-cadmium resistance protein CzcI (plasmid) [Cupriavidus taiwanensis]|uniref:Cobalt-zinc-cadmium resistance protein CzcI n=1 Tax=Cupriavidus taiwanensis TaxID=164546 RepID=A0A375ISY4_9BURK|nr:cation efflux protein, CzcI family [Cupriavidus taiwanensis]SPK76552.1 Cobalt-zinc-cadmium resistance protein CzcI [Cupriavidus taiwanensis]